MDEFAFIIKIVVYIENNVRLRCGPSLVIASALAMAMLISFSILSSDRLQSGALCSLVIYMVWEI